MISRSLQLLSLSLLGVLAVQPSAHAASASWSGASNGNWNDSGNWSAAFPNAVGDLATFNSISVNNSITLGQAITVKGIVFDTANVGAYTISGSSTELSLASTGVTGIVINSTVGAVTQTINARVNIVVNSPFTNSSTLASLNLAGGINAAASGTSVATINGAGNGGTINGLTQTTGTLAATISNTGGIFEITGTTNATGILNITGTGGTRISSDVSSMTLANIAGRVQINNNLTGGGFNPAGGMTTAAGSVLEAYGADRTINTTTHTLNASTFAGSQSLTISSLATMSAASGQITNNIGAGKALTFDAANFYLNNTNATVTRTIGGTGETRISSDITNNAGANTAAAAILKTGDGTLRLSGSNSYTGSTQINGGVLSLDSVNALGGGVLILNGGILGLGAGDFTRALNTTAGTFRFAAATSGFAAYVADRIVNIAGNGATHTWASTSNFVAAGQSLVLGSSDSTNKVIYQNGINLNNAERTILVNDGTSSTNEDGEISGVISSTTPASGALMKTGLGTLTLSNNNTYSGLSTVSAGRLLVTGTLAGGASVSAGATLGGTGKVTGAVTVSGTLAPGTSAGTLSTGALTLDSASVSKFELTNGNFTIGTGVNDLVNVTGDFTLDGTLEIAALGGTLVDGTYRLFNYTGTLFNNTLNISSAFLASNPGSTIDFGTAGVINLVVVPEPAASMMLALGLGGMFLVRRRRK